MQQREKLLLGVIAALLVVAAGQWVVRGMFAARDTRDTQITLLERGVIEKDGLIERGERAETRLKQYQDRSLPTDRLRARTLYQNWLVGLCDAAKLKRVHVDSSWGTSRPGVYDRLLFSVRAQGSLAQMTEWLHALYSANHLHQLRRLTVSPIDKSDQLDLIFTIEALALAGHDRTDSLADETSDRLAGEELEAFRKPIVDRNLFARYNPAGANTAQASPEISMGRQTYVTAIVQSAGVWKVWLDLRASGEMRQLGEGDTFSMGPVEGQIGKIEDRQVEIEFAGRRQTYQLGDSLRPNPGGAQSARRLGRPRPARRAEAADQPVAEASAGGPMVVEPPSGEGSVAPGPEIQGETIYFQAAPDGAVELQPVFEAVTP